MRQLSAVGAADRASSALNGSGHVSVSASRPLALVGVRIPSRNAVVRRNVVALFRECSWLMRADVPASVRWGVLGEKFRKLAAHLDRLPDGGVVRANGDPRKALGELRALSAEVTRLEASLGITASARASLGVDLSRMKDLGALVAGEA